MNNRSSEFFDLSRPETSMRSNRDERGADLFRIVVTSNGTRIGSMSADEFRAYMGSKSSFLQTLVEGFNALKARMGEPERVNMELAR